MSRITRWAVLAAMLASLFAMLSSSAGAVTWHNSGDTAFTASGGASTMTVTAVNLACTGSNQTGTSPSASFVGNTYMMASGTVTYTGCTLSGVATTSVCDFLLYTAATSPPPWDLALLIGWAVCRIYQFGVEICRVEGQTTGGYNNPVNPSTFGKITISSSTALRTTNGSGATCPLGAGEPLALTAQTWTISSAGGGATTPHLGPRITRTA